jgi:hypothetical protein
MIDFAELLEFVLARIAEREKRARKCIQRAQENYRTVRNPRLLGREIPGWHEWPEIEADAIYTLADCEAKRFIVNEYKRLGFAETYLFPEEDIAAIAIQTGLEIALRAFAALDAAHPDYREEWKP